MKIVLIIPTLRVGGAERVCAILANNLCKNHIVSLIKFDDDEPFYPLDDKIKFIFKKQSKNFFFRFFCKLLMIRKYAKDADIVISFMDSTNLYAILATFCLGAKLIISEHSSFLAKKPIWISFLRRVFYPFADSLCVLNQADVNYYSNFVSNVYKVSNPIDFKINDNYFKENIVLFVGRLETVKNPFKFLRIASLLNLAKCIAIGDGILKDELINLNKSLNNPVEFICSTRDIELFYKRAKVIINTSISESFGNVLVEAGAFGCVRIATPTAGAMEIIEHGKDGFIMDNEHDIAKITDDLLKNDEFRKQIATNARLKVEKFKINNILILWDDIFRKIKNRPKRILFVISRLANGGAERVLFFVAHQYALFGYDVKILVLRDSKAMYEYDDRVNFIYPSKKGIFFRYKTIIRELWRCDLVISFMDYTSVQVGILNFIFRRNHIISEHLCHDVASSFFAFLRDKIYAKANALVVLNSFDKLYYSRFVKKCKIIQNPQLLQKIVTKKTKMILGVGRLEKIKSYHRLIYAFACLDTKDYTLVIVGDGSQKSSLISLANELKVDVVFTGHLNDSELAQYYANAKIFVNTSISESFGNVLVEAGAFGCVRIATPTAGAMEIIEHGKDGILLDSCDDSCINGLVDALNMLINNNELCDKISNNGVLSTNKYDKNLISLKWIKLANDILG